MSIRVYHADSNPAVERFSYRLSDNRGRELVERGEGFFFNLEDGRVAVKLFRAKAERENWIERLEKAVKSASPMPRLRWIPPQNETWKRIQAESKIVNVRALTAVA